MSSYYGVIFPEFWTGRTGRELREQGGKDAQLLALYLATNRHANMIGLYKLQIVDIRYETGLGTKAIERGFASAMTTGFAIYDAVSEYVWVYQMARFRLGLNPGASLAAEDKRVIGVNKLYHGIAPNPFLADFYDRNHTALKLRKAREAQGIAVPYTISGPLEGASQGLTSQDQDQDQVQRSGSVTSKQNQEKARPAAPARNSKPENENKNPAAVRELVFQLVRGADPSDGFADLKDLAKEACAKAHLDYDPELVGSALEQALARREVTR